MGVRTAYSQTGIRAFLAASTMPLDAMFFAGLAKATFTFQDVWKASTTHDLEGCLHTLHALLLASFPKDQGDPGVRITLHVPVKVKGEQCLEQLCGYVGAETRGKKKSGRRMSAHCGIIGQAFRTGKMQRANRTSTDPEEYMRALQEQWHFSEEQAQAIDLSVMSFIAVPLPDNSGIVAVLYADAKRQNFFTAQRQKIVEDGCRGIALFIGRRYNS